MDRQSEDFYKLLLRYREYIEGINGPKTVRDAVERMIDTLSRERPMDPEDLDLLRSFVEDMDTANPDYETVLESIREYEDRLSP